MERSRNFYKTIRLGYILISVLIGCIAYNSFYEWQEIEALELDNKKIDEFRKEINNINIQMIKFSLFGETILEWNDKDIEHYHAQRMAMDSTCNRAEECAGTAQEVQAQRFLGHLRQKGRSETNCDYHDAPFL